MFQAKNTKKCIIPDLIMMINILTFMKTAAYNYLKIITCLPHGKRLFSIT